MKRQRPIPFFYYFYKCFPILKEKSTAELIITDNVDSRIIIKMRLIYEKIIKRLLVRFIVT